jgi:hypothetical protein
MRWSSTLEGNDLVADRNAALRRVQLDPAAIRDEARRAAQDRIVVQIIRYDLIRFARGLRALHLTVTSGACCPGNTKVFARHRQYGQPSANQQAQY